jgi:hypothetical protein
MNKLSLLVLPLIAFSAIAEARWDAPADKRGYETCKAAFRASSDGLVTERHHFIDKRAENPRYYINGTRWENGNRTAVKMACETHLNGSRVLLSEISTGRYANRQTSSTMDIADTGN